MRSTLLVNSYEAWIALKTVTAQSCVLSQLGDIHPFEDGPIVKAETVVFDNCNKNFVFYWLNEETFPCMKKLVLASHPCEPRIVNWMARQHQMEILVHQNRFSYVNRWCPNVNREAPHIKPISDDEYRTMLGRLLAKQYISTAKQ